MTTTFLATKDFVTGSQLVSLNVTGALTSSWVYSPNSFKHSFDVMEFGAKGNGVTDDAPAFKAAISAAYYYAQQHPNIVGGKVVIPPGNYVLSSTIDLTTWDPLGATYSLARMTLEGSGRYNTTLNLAMGTGSDGLVIGAYSVLKNFGMIGAARMPITTKVTPGNNVERILIERVWCRSVPSASNYGIQLFGPVYSKFDTVQALGGFSVEPTPAVSGSGSRNVYDCSFENCDVTNGVAQTVPAFNFHGHSCLIQGGNYYSYTGSLQPTINIRSGSIRIIDVDFRFTSLTSLASYDVIVGSGSTVGTHVTIENCALGYPGKTSVTGVRGNVLVNSGSCVTMIENRYEGTPGVFLATGSLKSTIVDYILTSSDVAYQGGALSSSLGSYHLKNETIIGVKLTASQLRVDGSSSFSGPIRLESEQWDDLTFPVNQAAGNAALSWLQYGTTGMYFFHWKDNASPTAEVLNVTWQMPHGWKRDSEVRPHMHIIPVTAPAANRVLAVTGAYAWSHSEQVLTSASWTPFSSTLAINTGSGGTAMILSLFSTIPTGAKESSILCAWFKRDVGGADTYTDGAENIAIISVDAHIKKEKNGTQDYIPS